MKKVGLSRHLSLLGLVSTGVCSMLGASIYVVPFMIQKNVPGIGPYVLPAFLLAAVPATLAAISYAILGSAMPRAGGSYIYASRGLSPYLGFVASFSQWFGLSIAIGVISYVIVPFFRDIAAQLELTELATFFDNSVVRVTLALTLLWGFVFINLLGITTYQKTVVPLMFLMFGLGAVVIIAGYIYNHADFLKAAKEQNLGLPATETTAPFQMGTFLAAAALLFSSFIGFDSIAQAGGEANNPSRSVPLATLLAVVVVGTFYFVFTGAVYHAVPWNFVAQRSASQDITAAGLLGYLVPKGWAIAITGGAAIALLNDLPAMILSVSRLMFAWAEDRIFPSSLAKIDGKFHTPRNAIIASGLMASVGILGSHFAGDFFLGIDIMVTSMLVNFLFMCIAVVALPKINPPIAAKIAVIRNRSVQLVIAGAGVLMLSAFLVIHITKDLGSNVSAWYFHSTPVWLIVMTLASVIYWRERQKLKSSGVDISNALHELPPE